VTETLPTDAELAARCRSGEQAAWELLVERYARYVYAIAVQGFRLSATDAEDVFQDTFLRVHERLGTLRNDEALKPWIAQVTRRLCHDRLAATRPAEELVDEVAATDVLDRVEAALDVHDALEALEPPCRDLLDRFFVRDEPYRVIATALDLPIGTVASRISRCLEKLRVVLADGRNLACPESGE
jgi:RNA polymerase sigma-70 factor (ECF subfamily)